MRLGFRSTVTTLVYLFLACGLSAQLHYHLDHAAPQTGAVSSQAGARDGDGSGAPLTSTSRDDCPTCHQLTNGSFATIVLPIVSFLNESASSLASMPPEQSVIIRFACAPTAPRAPPSL